MDEVILKNSKTGKNSENSLLGSQIADKRVFPAMDILKFRHAGKEICLVDKIDWQKTILSAS